MCLFCLLEKKAEIHLDLFGKPCKFVASLPVLPNGCVTDKHVQCFPQETVRLGWVDLGPSKGVQAYAHLERNFVHFNIKCINLALFESEINRQDL